MIDQPTDKQTDQQTDRPTDRETEIEKPHVGWPLLKLFIIRKQLQTRLTMSVLYK